MTETQPTVMKPGEGMMMIPIDPNAPIVFPTTEQQLKTLEEKMAIDKMPTDLSVKENHELVRVSIAECRTVRGTVEKKRKEIVSPLVEYQRNVNQTAKDIISRVTAVEDPLKERKKEHDDKVEIERREAAKKEEARIDGINLKMAKMGTILAECMALGSGDVVVAMEKLENDNLDWADEFKEKADVIRLKTINQLTELRDMKVNAEEMQRRQDEQKAREAEEKAEAEKARLAKEKEENEKKEALRLKQEAEAKERQKTIDAQNAEIKRQQDEIKKAQDDLAAEKQARVDEEAARQKAEQDAKDLAEKQKAEAEQKIKREAEEKEQKAREEKIKKDQEAEAKRLAEENERHKLQRIQQTCRELDELLEDVLGPEAANHPGLAGVLVAKIVAGEYSYIKWVD